MPVAPILAGQDQATAWPRPRSARDRSAGDSGQQLRSCSPVSPDLVDVQDLGLFDEQIGAVYFEPERREPAPTGRDDLDAVELRAVPQPQVHSTPLQRSELNGCLSQFRSHGTPPPRLAARAAL